MRLFGSENIEGLLDRLGMDDSMPIEHPMISRAIENAQRKVEARNFNIRKNVLEYDDVINQQREVMYSERKKVLAEEDLKETVLAMIDDVAQYIVDMFAGERRYAEEWDLEGLISLVEQNYAPIPGLSVDTLKGMTKREVLNYLQDEAREMYEDREEELGSKIYAN